MNVSSQVLQRCLPDRLASLGYRSIALHGLSGNLFSRQTWYKSIGFQEQWFRDQFRQEGLPDCLGAFTGTCDAAVSGWIGHRLETKDASPIFAYWVTLNSHLPLPVPSGLPAAASCSYTPLLATQPVLCSWYQFWLPMFMTPSRGSPWQNWLAPRSLSSLAIMLPHLSIPHCEINSRELTFLTSFLCLTKRKASRTGQGTDGTGFPRCCCCCCPEV